MYARKSRAPDEDDNDGCPRLRDEGEGGGGRTLVTGRFRSQLAHAFVLAPSSMVPWVPSDNGGDHHHKEGCLYSVRPTFLYFTFFVYLSIYCFPEQLHNPPHRLESPPNLKHAPNKLAIYLPRRQVPRSCSAHLGHALQYYKCFTLFVAERISVLTEFYSAQLLNDVLREFPGKSFSAPKHPRRTLPGLLLRAALTGGCGVGWRWSGLGI